MNKGILRIFVCLVYWSLKNSSHLSHDFGPKSRVTKRDLSSNVFHISMIFLQEIPYSKDIFTRISIFQWYFSIFQWYVPSSIFQWYIFQSFFGCTNIIVFPTQNAPTEQPLKGTGFRSRCIMPLLWMKATAWLKSPFSACDVLTVQPSSPILPKN